MISRMDELRRTAISRLADSRPDAGGASHARPPHRRHRHDGPGTQRPGHLQQHRQPAHHRLQAPARRISRTCSTRTSAAPASATSDQGTHVPAGIAIGSGVKTGSTARVMTQGNLTSTEKEYDVAIRGEGFFRIRMPDGRTAYTRDGSFDLDAPGPARHPRRLPRRARHHGAAERAAASPSTRRAQVAGDASRTRRRRRTLGQIQLARFVNKVGLESIGDNLFLETPASGPADRRQSRRRGLRQPAAGLSRGRQRQRGDRDLVADRGAARLRDELEGRSPPPTRCCRRRPTMFRG